MNLCYKNEDKFLRHLLAFFIIPGKSSNIKNILKLALKNYLITKDCELCVSIIDAIYHYNKKFISMFDLKK